MRILSVHNRYQEPGGEDTVFEAEASLLESRGHDVQRLEFDNHEIDAGASLVARSHLAIRTIWSRTGSERVVAAVREGEVDLVHFHNTFPLVSPAAYAACQHLGVPVVQTLHNYRMLCPDAYLFRDGQPCGQCVGKAIPWPGVTHACYHDSRPQTAVIATMLAAHRLRGTWRNDIDRYIVLTEFARQKFVVGGSPPEKLVVKPNFVATESGTYRPLPRSPFLFAGRLAPQKGITTLLAAWERLPCPPPLRIIGTGPLDAQVTETAAAQPSIQPMGRRPRADVLDKMRTARALVFPSEWYEGFPMTICEAFACGTPVIGSRLGAMAEIINDGQTGLLFTPGDADDLAAKVRWAWEHPEEMRRMGEAARREYEEKYTPERNFEMLMDIYHQAIEHSQSRHRTRGSLSR